MALGPFIKDFRPLAEFILSTAEGLGVTFRESLAAGMVAQASVVVAELLTGAKRSKN